MTDHFVWHDVAALVPVALPVDGYTFALHPSVMPLLHSMMERYGNTAVHRAWQACSGERFSRIPKIDQLRVVRQMDRYLSAFKRSA